MKLKINHTFINSKNEKIISHTIERDIVKKRKVFTDIIIP